MRGSRAVQQQMDRFIALGNGTVITLLMLVIPVVVITLLCLFLAQTVAIIDPDDDEGEVTLKGRVLKSRLSPSAEKRSPVASRSSPFASRTSPAASRKSPVIGSANRVPGAAAFLTSQSMPAATDQPSALLSWAQIKEQSGQFVRTMPGSAPAAPDALGSWNVCLGRWPLDAQFRRLSQGTRHLQASRLTKWPPQLCSSFFSVGQFR